MTLSELVTLAIGADNARKVDHAIPQGVFDKLSAEVRADVAGWYYDPDTAPTFGRLLSQSECWRLIRARIERGELVVVDPVAFSERVGP